MKTDQVFLRWYECDEDGDEKPDTSTFEPLSNLYYDGSPIDENGDICSSDHLVYRRVKGKEGEFEIIPD